MTTREKVVSAQLRSLLSGLSDHGTLHLTEIETDLVQTTFLLGEAIEKLGTSFMAIHESICSQQRLVDELLANTTTTVPEFQERMNAVQGEISQNINAAVTGLQFQDMTSQLVGRTVRRVNGLRDVMASLGSGSSDLTQDAGLDEVIVALEGLNKLIEDQSVKLESGLWKAVHQTHMESGDIELF